MIKTRPNVANDQQNPPTPAGKRLYLAYGSNMDNDQMALRCPGAIKLRICRLEGYRFITNTDGLATLIPCQEAMVQGVLWAITPRHEQALDQYEGVDHNLYLKNTVPVSDAEGKKYEALVYLAGNAKPGRANRPYLLKIIKAATDHHLPMEYVLDLIFWLRRDAPICTLT